MEGKHIGSREVKLDIRVDGTGCSIEFWVACTNKLGELYGEKCCDKAINDPVTDTDLALDCEQVGETDDHRYVEDEDEEDEDFSDEEEEG